jgi:C-terminal domain on Strawberry notch homologue/Toprim-like/P-loop containing NTP hydrolase pore-1/Protein of unknown function (DUF3991)/MutS domain I
MAHPQLVQHFTEHFLQGESFKTIGMARRQAAELLSEPVKAGSPLTKVIDESLEAALVRVARSITGQPGSPQEIYDRLVDLHQRQPVLGVRSSTSISMQAYSTPLPIAYLASILADITPEHTVYEPTAGHGALLITAIPVNTTVNELNPDRATDLRAQGYIVTERDATAYQPERLHDRIICNPPFGVAKYTNRKTKRFELAGNRRGTTQIDQVIALRALEVMKSDGRAVLILGGKLGDDPTQRSERYNSLDSRGFFRILYDQYNVTQHISIWGSLYRKQGAGFPIDLIVIEGKGKSELLLPAVRVPPIFKSFSDLKEFIPHDRLQHLSPDLATRAGGLSEPDAGARAFRSATNQQGTILGIDGATDRVADATLDGANRRDATPNPPSPLPSLRSVEPDANAAGLDGGQWRPATPVVVDTGMGRDLHRPQRYPQTTDLDGISRPRADSRSPGSDAAVESDPRQADVGGLVGGIDFRHDDRQRPVKTSEGKIMDNVQSYDVSYVPRSQGRIGETIIPTNMAAAAQKALDKLEQAVGNIDVFVQQRLGYDSPEHLWRHFYAEQIDAIALAFHQRDQGNIFLNGDQTGNGKGRFGAANLIDASRQDYIPVFVTQKSNLYNAMINDLADVGRPNFRVFATDNKLKLKLDDGRRLVTGNAADQEAEMQRILEQGLGRNYQAIFTTYSQLQTVGAEEPFRRDFFRAIAPRAVFIFDEAHEAGGVSKIGTWKTNGPPNRADFVRELVDLSAGAVFMSATSIKSSTVIDLYARRSDARHAVQHIDNLEIILKDGGVPLQQMFATKFVASGQMIRRGRSMAGISFDSKIVSVDRNVAESISAIMRAINGFDEAKQEALRQIDKELKAEAKAISIDNAIGQAGVRSSNFTSLMHNAIDQSLLAQKAEVTVQEAIAAIKRGEKPLIAVASTMDSFINWYAKEHGIKPGEPVTLTFGDVLHRYLERSRDILVKDYEGKSTRHRLTDLQLGVDGVTAYQEALDLIEETDLSAIPLSSIDYIKWRLTQSGYRVDEITGRENIIEYSQAGMTEYGLRPEKEVSPQGRIDIVNRFNRGHLDVVILNRSGATGISLHASEQFVDQRPRHMIVAQAERDVNLVMQMLGRINRFGQVNKPQFTLLMSDLPAEKRLGALLAKKMAELNANVTAARESDLSIANVVDFMNVYGEAVITEMLEEDIELQAKLGYPLKSSEDSEIGVIKRVTGRIPLLTMQEQEDLYTLIQSETQDLITQKEAMGESVLRADQLDLEARTIARMEVIPDESGVNSEFTGPVCLEIVDAKVPIKPLTQLQVVNAVREHLNLAPVKDVTAHDFYVVEAISQQQAQATLATVRQATEAYRQQALNSCKSDSGRDKLNARLDEQLFHLGRVFQETPPGSTVRVVSPEGNIFYGVVSRISQKGQNGSPAAPTNWKVQVLIDHRSRQLTIPLAKFNRGKDDAATHIASQARNWEGEGIYEAFDIRQTQSQRTEMQIFTGNPIKAYEKFPKGKFVNYTNDQGEIVQGLVMPASFDIQTTLREESVAFHEPHQVKAFLTDVTKYLGAVKTLDELLTVKTQVGARFGNPDATGFVLQTVKSGAGDRYSLDADIINAAGAEFYSISDRMECIVPEDRIDQVLRVILKEKHWTLAAFDFKDQARNFLGVKLPEFKSVEIPAESQVTLTLPPQIETAVIRVLSSNQQRGTAEKNVAQFLEQAGLAAAVMADPEFHLQVQNEPYIPLTIERHEVDIHFIHWLKDSAGDLFIDSEMIFQLANTGHLTLFETAVQNALTGGESRGRDQSFAVLFSQNILQQGFAEAARQMQGPEQPVDVSPQRQPLPQRPAWEWQQVDRSDLTAAALAYLQLKDQHPTALALQRSPSDEFYQAFFSDAQTIAKAVDFIVMHKDLGNSARQAPTLLIPASPGVMERITEYLQAQGFEVVVDEGVHQIEMINEQPTTLFDMEPFTTPVADYQVDVQGHDPTWERVAPVNSLTQTNLKTLADQVREFDLESVAERLGLERDRHDKHKWRDSTHIISITDGQFNDWTVGQGGGGAIDLVRHVQNVDFKTAVQWLAGQTLPTVERQVRPQPELCPFELPTQVENNWATVRNYLIESRGLPEKWVDGLHQQGLIYADAHRNAVFLRHQLGEDGQPWSRGHPTGANLRGTDPAQAFHGLATGSVREQGWFWIRMGKESVQRVVLVESAIDALSLAVLEKQTGQPHGTSVYLSTDGSGAVPVTTLQGVMAQGGQVVVAFDADKAGEKLAWRVAEAVPGVQRMVPSVGKDWNERLVAEQHPAQVRPALVERGDQPTLQTLWKWHRVARDEGKSEKYLRRITEVAREVVDGKLLSEQATAAMARDIQGHQPMSRAPGIQMEPQEKGEQVASAQLSQQSQGVEVDN